MTYALITRPREDAVRLAEILAGRGLEIAIEPMLQIRFRTDIAPDLSGVQAIVITSANGVRALAARSDDRSHPLFAVGEASARAARDLGWSNVHVADGDVESLARLIKNALPPQGGALFHAAADIIAKDLQPRLERWGFSLRRQVLYDAQPIRAFSPPTLHLLKNRKIGLILFFSPRTAETFASLLKESGLVDHMTTTCALCLSPAIAAVIRDVPWQDLQVAAKPDTPALLIELDKMLGPQ